MPKPTNKPNHPDNNRQGNRRRTAQQTPIYKKPAFIIATITIVIIAIVATLIISNLPAGSLPTSMGGRDYGEEFDKAYEAADPANSDSEDSQPQETPGYIDGVSQKGGSDGSDESGGGAPVAAECISWVNEEGYHLCYPGFDIARQEIGDLLDKSPDLDASKYWGGYANYTGIGYLEITTTEDVISPIPDGYIFDYAQEIIDNHYGNTWMTHLQEGTIFHCIVHRYMVDMPEVINYSSGNYNDQSTILITHEMVSTCK